MRSHVTWTLAFALCAVGPTGLVAQVPVPPGFDIETVPWDTLQAHLDGLTFDFNPLYSDAQTLVYHGPWGKGAGPTARIAARTNIHLVSSESLASGMVVGIVKSSGKAEAIGVFNGTTYIWVDRDEAGQWRWLSIKEDLPGTPTDVVEEILNPLEGAFARATPPGKGKILWAVLSRVPATDPGQDRGAFWNTAFPASSFQTYEVDGCVVCDGDICCPGGQFETFLRPGDAG